MASTPSSTQADLPFDGGDAATETDNFTEVEDELARLVQAKYAPRISGAFGAAMLDADNLRPPNPRAPRSRRDRGTSRGALAGVALAVCLGAAAIWAWRSHGDPPAEDIVATADTPSGTIPAHLAADPVPPMPDPAPAPSAAAATAAPPAPPPAQAAPQVGWPAAPQTGWQGPPPARSIAPPATSIAPPARSIAPPTRSIAPPAADAPDAAAEPAQGKTSELAALRETVEALAAGQRKLTVDIARLQAQKPDRLLAAKSDRPPAETPHRHSPHREAAHRPPPAAAPAHKSAAITPAPLTPMPLPPTRQAAAMPVTAPPRPALQIPAGPQSANAPLRPPMPVP